MKQETPTAAPTVGHALAAATARYATLPVFRAFANDRIPVARFPEFLREQAMTARLFQDLIWATTAIDDGPFAAFAAQHRRIDSGHHKWAARDLEKNGLAPMTSEDWFALDMLPTRIQMARILAACHDADATAKMVILASLERAGEVTLGVLNAYVHRHGLERRAAYLGDHHVRIEEGQHDGVEALLAEVMESSETQWVALVALVFDALTTMFEE